VSTTDVLMFVRKARNPRGRWISVNGRPLGGPNGRRNGGVVVFRDVSEQMRTLSRMDRLRSAVEQTADLVVITNRAGEIEYVNPAFETVTGYDRSETIGRTPGLLKSGLHDDSFFARMWSTLLAGEVYKGTITNRRKNGEIFYSQQTISPMRDAGGRLSHFVSVGKDVTVLRQAEDQRTKMVLARAVQQRFYPTGSPAIEEFDIAGAAYPADATGGDYFDYVTMPDSRIGVAIGDVSGHGFDTALLMSETRAYLRSMVNSFSDVGQVLTATNKVLATDIEANRFVTLFLARFDPSTHSFIYGSAGHETGFVLDREGRLKHDLPSRGVPLGMFGDTVYDSSPPVTLETGEIAILLTDGVTEAEAVDGSMFSRDRALAIVGENRTESAREIVRRLYLAIRDFIQGHPQSDDITVVVCKRP
jgi:sigma-B regulation protein RsbU (phosphoserine phosphatase)